MWSRLRSICFESGEEIQGSSFQLAEVEDATSSKAGTFVPKGPSDESSLNLLFQQLIRKWSGTPALLFKESALQSRNHVRSGPLRRTVPAFEQVVSSSSSPMTTDY
jgi:hypothetical protein